MSEPVEKKNLQIKADSAYPMYDKNSEKYEFEWDPEILTDIVAKVHNR